MTHKLIKVIESPGEQDLRSVLPNSQNFLENSGSLHSAVSNYLQTVGFRHDGHGDKGKMNKMT
eukprot:252012-Hanusia_phi.AAC.2